MVSQLESGVEPPFEERRQMSCSELVAEPAFDHQPYRGDPSLGHFREKAFGHLLDAFQITSIRGGQVGGRQIVEGHRDFPLGWPPPTKSYISR